MFVGFSNASGYFRFSLELLDLRNYIPADTIILCCLNYIVDALEIVCILQEDRDCFQAKLCNRTFAELKLRHSSRWRTELSVTNVRRMRFHPRSISLPNTPRHTYSQLFVQ